MASGQLAIEKIIDRKSAVEKKALKKVQTIMRVQFPGEDRKLIDELPNSIFENPKPGFRTSLYVAKEGAEIVGFIIYSYFARENFYYLDYMAAAPGQTGKGIGRVFYELIQAKARAKNSVGIFFECLNDDPVECLDEKIRERNTARLRFYERNGARPLVNTRYEERVRPECNSALLVIDMLGQDSPARLPARRIIRKIIEKKYSDFCPPGYIRRVLDSIKDDPIRLREMRNA